MFWKSNSTITAENASKNLTDELQSLTDKSVTQKRKADIQRREELVDILIDNIKTEARDGSSSFCYDKWPFWNHFPDLIEHQDWIVEQLKSKGLNVGNHKSRELWINWEKK